MPFDLSRVMFICTANVLDTIPGPLRDRMEVIQLPGYTAQEKLQIARRYLVARQLAATGLLPEQCEITDDALIGDHRRLHARGRRAQPRARDRQRYAATSRCASPKAAWSAMTVGRGRPAPRSSAPRKFEAEVAMRTGVPGVATGLAWTPVGGDILFIEAARMPGSGQADPHRAARRRDEGKRAGGAVAGQGALRQSSASTPEMLEKSDIHIHVPAGATPKDGPSAGVAMFTALASLLTGRPVRSDVAMTGEISLRGLVLPIGGVKEKVLAALRAGITTVMLPARNRRDLEDIPAEAREKLEFVWLEHVDDALKVALSKRAETLE